MRPLALLLLAALAAPPAAGPQPSLSVTATASSQEVGVGQRFEVAVSVSGPEGTLWSFPERPPAETVELALLPEDPARPAAPGTRHYRGLAFALDAAEVPAIAVGYRLPDGGQGELVSEPIPLRIVSLLPADPEQQALADIRPPQPLRIRPAFWWAIGLAVLALALAGVALWRRLRRPAPAPAAPTPPDVEALAALDRLGADGLAQGDFRGYYIELASIAKRYLERRLHAPVLEMTTAEASAFLRHHPDGQCVFPALRELAVAADQVKFARADSQADQARRHLEAAKGLVRLLEEQLRPAAAPRPREPAMSQRRAAAGDRPAP